MLTVLGIDLASASWSSNGSAEVVFDATAVRDVRPGAIAWPTHLPLSAFTLADVIDAHVRAREIRAVALDGPQGWRDPSTPEGTRGVGRRCELACQTQGKTGAYGITFPRTQRPWIEFCIAVFDSLLARPGVVLANELPESPPASGYVLLECFPTSAWRSTGIAPLPGKGRRSSLAPYAEALRRAYALPRFEVVSHDDLQAVVAALCAASIVGGPLRALPRGRAAFIAEHDDGVHRLVEGIIWDVEPSGGAVDFAIPTAVDVRQSLPSRERPPTRRAPRVQVRSTPPTNIATARVTRGVLVEVSRAGRDHPKMIALRNVPGGTRAAPRLLALSIEGEEYRLLVGDSHAVWRTHQTPATLSGFDALFALLASRPDHAVVIDSIRQL